jgi:hypothetical protein
MQQGNAPPHSNPNTRRTSMSDDFKNPGSTEGVQWADHKGSLLLFKVHSVELGISTQFGDTDAVRADVVILDGANEGTVITDTLVFPKVLQSQIKGAVGSMVLGRLGQGQAKKGQSAPWKLADAEEADKVIAREYLAANSAAPF